MKNKNLIIGVAVALVIIVVVGGFFVLNKSKSTNNTSSNSTSNQSTGTIQTLESKDIGLTLSASPDSKKVQFAINNLTGITAISYELTYQADSTLSEKAEGADATVQRGITGDAKLDSSTSYTSPWLDLGTCSSGTCRYDTGVTSVDLILKVTKDGGKVYQVEQKLSL